MTESVLATLRSSPTVLCVRFFFRTELWFNYHSLHLVTSHHRLFQFFLMRHLLALSSHLCAGRSHVLSRILLDWPFRALVCLAAAWPWSIRWYSSMSSISSPKRERERDRAIQAYTNRNRFLPFRSLNGANRKVDDLLVRGENNKQLELPIRHL